MSYINLILKWLLQNKNVTNLYKPVRPWEFKKLHILNSPPVSGGTGTKFRVIPGVNVMDLYIVLNYL